MFKKLAMVLLAVLICVTSAFTLAACQDNATTQPSDGSGNSQTSSPSSGEIDLPVVPV